MDKKISPSYRYLYDLIWRLMAEDLRPLRTIYGKWALEQLEIHQEKESKTEKAIDDMTERLATAANKITDLSEALQFSEDWRACLYKALGKDLNFYVRKALMIKREKEGE